MTLLLATSRRDGQDALDEDVARVTVRTEAAFAPEHRRAQRLFRHVFRRLDPSHADERPQCRPQGQQLPRERLHLVRPQGDATFQQRMELGLYRLKLRLQAGSIAGASTE